MTTGRSNLLVKVCWLSVKTFDIKNSEANWCDGLVESMTRMAASGETPKKLNIAKKMEIVNNKPYTLDYTGGV